MAACPAQNKKRATIFRSQPFLSIWLSVILDIKLFFEIINGGHAAANGPSGANGDTGIYALSWLKTYLSESPCYCEFLLAESSAASAFETNIECASSSLIQESIKD